MSRGATVFISLIKELSSLNILGLIGFYFLSKMKTYCKRKHGSLHKKWSFQLISSISAVGVKKSRKASDKDMYVYSTTTPFPFEFEHKHVQIYKKDKSI